MSLKHSGLYGRSMYGRGIDALGPRLQGVQSDVAGWGLKKAFRKVKKAARKSVKRATRVAATTTGARFVPKKIKRQVKRWGPTALRAAGAGASFVPGVGTGVAAGLGTAASLAEGRRLDRALQQGAIAAVPGGALAQAGVGAGLALARGKSPGSALMVGGRHLARGYGGAAGEAAYQAARGAAAGIRRGQDPRQAITRAATRAGTAAARQQLRRAMPTSTRLSAALRSPDPLRGAFLGAKGRPGDFGTIAARLAAQAIRRRPSLATKSSYELARQLGVPHAAAADALRRAKALRWRPLRRRATAMVKRLARGYPSRFLARTETSGLAPDGATWTIEKGDTLWNIAKQLTGRGNRWTEIRDANPDVPRHPEWGLRVYAGDVIRLPADWVKAQEPEAPAIAAAQIMASKATLKAWSTTDGADQPGPDNYGMRPEDIMPTWGPRDRLILTSFSQWRGKGLATDGELTQPHVDELALWAEEKAGDEVTVPSPTPPAPPPPAVEPTPEPTFPVPSVTPSLPGPPVLSGPPATPIDIPAPAPVPGAPPPGAAPAPVAAAPKKTGTDAGIFAALLGAAAFLLS